MGEVVGYAVAIAASPFPIIPAILLLFTPRPRATSVAFLVGWVVGILAAVVVFVVAAELVEGATGSPRWLSWLRIVLGLALVVYGVRQWLSRHESAEPPAWMRSLDSATPRSALRLGLLLSGANPKVLLIAAGAGVVIGDGDATRWALVVEVLAFTAVAALSVAAPVVAYLVLGERVLHPLGVARDWLQRNNAAVMAVVLVVLGVVVALKGFQSL